MKGKLSLLLVFLPLLLFAQEEPKEEKIETHRELQMGQEFAGDGVGIEFLKVISDSRCPRQVTCIWAGEAEVLLGISVNGKYFEKIVAFSGMGAELQLPGQAGLLISNLDPYPETAKGIAPEDYCLSFTISRPK